MTQGETGSDGDDNYFKITAGGDINKSYDGFDGSFLAAQDTDDPDIGAGGAAPVQVKWTGIDITGQSSLEFKGKFGEVLDGTGDIDDDDFLRVEYQIDGGGYKNLIAFQNDGSTFNTEFLEDTDFDGVGEGTNITSNSGGLKSFTKSISETGDNLDLRFTAHVDSGDEDFAVDDFEVLGSDTRVRFASSGSTISEGNSGTTTVDVDVEIQNPSSTSSTSVDVAAIGGSATGGGDDYSFSSQTLTFSAGSSSPKTVSIDVNGDTETEGDETVDLGLSNATGGNNATVGTPGQYTLTIEGDDGATVQDGDVFIAEIMPDPSVSESDAEWIEVHNASNNPVDLKDWTIEDGTLGDGSGTHVIGSSVVVSPGEYVILCRNADQSANGGVYCDHEWSGPTLNNTGDTIGLLRPDDTVVDKVKYDDGTDWPNTEGASMVFTGTAGDNNNASGNWAKAGTREPGFSLDGTGSGDVGSPGARGSDQTLAVKRPMDSGTAGWRFVSPPTSGLTVQYLVDQGFVQGVSGSNPSGAPNVYLKYNPPDGSESSNDKQYWEAASDVSDALEQGRGVLWYLWTEDVPDFLTKTGAITGIDSDQAISGLGDHKWHLLGNPFPNSFRVGDLNASDFGVTAQVWIPNQGTYKTVGPNQATKAVGTQVGFFLERTTGIGGGNTASVTFPAAGQSLDAESVARKSARQSGRVALTMTGTNAAGDTTTMDRAATFVLDDQTGVGRDRYDATKLTPISAPYATLSFAPSAVDDDSTRRSVASYPLPADGKRSVALDIITGGDPDVESFTIRWPSLSLPSGWTATLVDSVSGEEIDLQDASAYTFSPSSKSKTAATVAAITDEPSTKGRARSASTKPVPPVPVALSRAVSEAAKQKNALGSTEERFALVLENPSALPVELSTFSAELDGEDARLSWRTASETNNSGFYVEHKADTTADTFRRLGFVDGAGTTQRAQSYTYRVKELAPGTHVFRLRQVDSDGTETVTDPVSVRVVPEASLTLSVPSPNPARTGTEVTIASRDETPVTMALFDALGRRVRTIHDGPMPGAKPRSITVRTDDLASGLYLLRATNGTRTVTRKLTVVQ